MLTLTLLHLAPLIQGPAQFQEARQFIDWTNDGPRLVREHRPAAVNGAGNGSGRSFGQTMRWEDDDNGQGWIADSVAVGDHGSLVMAGMFLNSGGYRLYPAGTWDPVFDARSDSLRTQVAVADYAATCAAISVYSSPATGGGYDHEPVLEVYLEGDASLPAWSASFPISDAYYSDGQGVRISDDGEVSSREADNKGGENGDTDSGTHRAQVTSLRFSSGGGGCGMQCGHLLPAMPCTCCKHSSQL